jgi:hypothetical protein
MGENPAVPTPVPVAFLLCDQISVDQTTGKKTIVGIFDRMLVGQFPTNYRPASLYARVIDCEGEYEVRVEYVQVSTQTVLGQAGGTLRSNNRHTYTDLVLPWPVIPILASGEYEFRLWMNNKFINSIRFTAQPRTEMEGQS